MIVYDKTDHKMLEVSSAKLEQVDDEYFGKKGIAIVFRSTDGECIKRACLSTIEGYEYLEELARFADEHDALVIVDNSQALGRYE